MVQALTPDPMKLISKGIQSVRQRVCNISDIVVFEDFEKSMLREVVKDSDVYKLTQSDENFVQEIANQKYRSDVWTYSVY